MAKSKDQKVAQEQEATDEQIEKERDVSAGNDVAAESQSEQQSDQDAFREEQRQQAAAQGLTDERAVPESRDPAFAQSNAVESDAVKRQREAGLIDPDPMPQSAYDKAESGAGNDEGRQEAIKVADFIEVVNEDSPYFKQRGSVVRLIFADEDGALRQGQPSQRFIEPVEFEARSIGGPVGDQTMMLQRDEVRKISEREWIGAA